MKKIFTLLLVLSSLELFAQNIYYVRPTGNDANSGTTWAAAFKTVQKALATAASGDQVWVAAGTYYPDEGPGQSDNDRSASFYLKTGVALYGGFAGVETEPGQRNWTAHGTVLSGDIDQQGGHGGNSYHVVRSTEVDSTAIIDGFTISGGNDDSEFGYGGGMYNASSSPTIAHCSFTGNAVTFFGAGMYNEGSSPTITHCRFFFNGMSTAGTLTYFGGGMYNASSSPTISQCSFEYNDATEGSGIYNGSSSPTITNCSFIRNWTKWFGGGMYNASSSPVITNCLFNGNTAGLYGGGINNDNASSPTITNCSFTNNEASSGGGIYNNGLDLPAVTRPGAVGYTVASGAGVYNGDPHVVITNCILWGNSLDEISNTGNNNPAVNYCLVKGGYITADEAVGNLDADPLFVDAGGGDLRLQEGSPAIDAGNNVAVPPYVTTDLDGQPRIVNGVVDMGAYEFQVAVPPITLACPADFTLQSNAGCGATADFTGTHAATASGGKGPITITYAPASGAVLPVGETTITAIATDSVGTADTCTFTVTVVDETPPVVTCPGREGSILLERTDNDACTYTIKGTELDVAATDNCAGPLSYFYSLSGATTTEGLIASKTLKGVKLNKGETTIHFVVRDAAGNEASCNLKIRVQDLTPPVISSVSVNTPVLYPPNHQLRTVAVAYTARDNCGVVSTTLSVTSNEPVNGVGDGNTAPDWVVIDDHHVKLRAERSGSGSGRIYTLTVTAVDSAGNRTTKTVTVSVPHDKGTPVTSARAKLVVQAVPNPSSTGFTLLTQSSSAQPLAITVMDSKGRAVERRSGVAANGVLYLGSAYRPGVYYVQVVQGAAVQTLKLVKQAR